MYTFASLTLVELAPIFTIYAGMLVAFYALVKFLINKADETQKADRQERQDILVKLNNTMERMAQASERSAREAEQRNGHLAEISNQNRDIIIKAVSNIKEQHVKKQTVENEVVKSKQRSRKNGITRR